MRPGNSFTAMARLLTLMLSFDSPTSLRKNDRNSCQIDSCFKEVHLLDTLVVQQAYLVQHLLVAEQQPMRVVRLVELFHADFHLTRPGLSRGTALSGSLPASNLMDGHRRRYTAHALSVRASFEQLTVPASSSSSTWRSRRFPPFRSLAVSFK